MGVRAKLGAVVVVLGAIGAAAGACGGSSDGGAAGPSGACTPGDTRTCVGPGACQGGQTCDAEGSGWGACDCGSAGAGGAGGDDAGSGGAGAGGADAGVGGSSGQGGAGGQALSNAGVEFWAVQLDQQDGQNDPVNVPWGVALANATTVDADVTIEQNDAPVGQAISTSVVTQLVLQAGAQKSVTLPVRTLDCGATTNDYGAPGTCLSSRAYRIRSSVPISAFQYNGFQDVFSNDASMLLPSEALGKLYRVVGWKAGHPVPLTISGIGTIVDRSYVTVVGTAPSTTVTVRPSWRIRGNPPIAATAAGGTIMTTLGPFDVLNLETDDATSSDDPLTVADLSGTAVVADQPVAVFSGAESAGAPDGVVQVPTFSGWSSSDTCCLDHLEEQLVPVEALGLDYVVTRSPVRSTTAFQEPDVVRFVGAAEPAHVTTGLPPPFASFTLQPGEVRTTWAQGSFVASADKPFLVGQVLVAGQYVEGAAFGDPSLTMLPSVQNFRPEYAFVTPTPAQPSWTQLWVVLAARVGEAVTLDGQAPTGCKVTPSGSVKGVAYESRACPIGEGMHRLAGSKPFGLVAYGYGSSASWALPGGALLVRSYLPPGLP